MKERLYEIYKIYGKLTSQMVANENFGGVKYKCTLDLSALNREFKLQLYYENPNKCLKCGEILAHSSDINIRKFCNMSCYASYNNYKRIKKVNKIVSTCLNCKVGIEHKGKYCSNKCQKEHQYNVAIEKWKNGDLKGYSGKTQSLSNYIRNFILNNYGSACSICGWDERHPIDGKILTEIDHIDGNAENCKIENLRVLCPNCHAKTPTFRARNKGSTRNRK